MNLAHLKKIRVFISLLFFVLTSYLFIDLSSSFAAKGSDYILYLQFIPSTVKFVNLITFASIGFIIFLIVTLLFGRVYCSSICPMGTLQDIISFISSKFRKKSDYRYIKRKTVLWYSFLIITLIFFISGTLFAVNMLDPFSNFGRIISTFVRPLVIAVNNLISFSLTNLNVYDLYPVEFKGLNWETLFFPAAILILVAWLSLKNGRLYCNSVCPVGALLGLVSRYSLFKIVVDENNCIACGECELVCKSGCIESLEKVIDFDRCVGCFNCFNTCPTNGLKYQFSLFTVNNYSIPGLDANKRSFLKQTLLYTIGTAVSLFAQQKIAVYKENKVKIFRNTPISPPGSISIRHFTNSCTACHLCISSCPTQVLQPAFLEYGFLGILQPRLDNKKGFCTHDCTICSEVCPSGAIIPIHVEQKKLTQLGRAKFIKENCVVETQKTECGACAEHCPTKAVKMVPYEKLMIPEVNDEICVGCGACEYACPTIPYKSIYVEGNEVHLLVQKPEEQKLEQFDLNDQFPF